MSQTLPVRISFRINGTYLMPAILMDQVPRVGDTVDFQLIPEMEEMFYRMDKKLPLPAVGKVVAVTWAPNEKYQWYVTVDTHHE